MTRFVKSVHAQRDRTNMTAVDADARMVVVALQAQVEAQQRAMRVLLHHFKIPGNNVADELEAALKIVDPTFGDNDEDDTDDGDLADEPVQVEPDGDYASVKKYLDSTKAVANTENFRDWRWRLERLTSLTDTDVFSFRNVFYAPQKDASNPAAIYIVNITQMREFDHLLDWAKRYFGSCTVGGGKHSPYHWWVRLDCATLSAHGLHFPADCIPATPVL
jgi:hypothetical protein